MAVINNVGYDGGTIEVSVEIDGKAYTFTGIEAINYGVSKESTKVKGAGIKARGRTPGLLNADDASMEIWITEMENWLAMTGGEEEWLKSNFDVTVTYRVAGNPLITKKLIDCTPISYASAHSYAGADNLVCTVNFSVLDVVTG